MPVKLIKIAFIILALVVLSTITLMIAYVRTGGGDYTIDLPGDYVMTRYHSGNVSISDASKIVVGPPVEKYAIQNHLLVGYVEKGERGLDADVRGYFILDTTTGETLKGLNRERWLAGLRTRGIHTVPRLKRSTAPLFGRQ